MALLALLLIALVGICVVVPRITGKQWVRARLSEATQATLGRGIEIASLEFALFPPSVIASGALIGSPSMPLVRAERIRLTPAIAPMLVGAFVIDSATLEGATIHLVRAPEEITSADAEIAAVDRAARSDLAVRGVSMSGATITLEDRSVAPPAVWTLRDVSARAVAEALGSPIRFDLAGTSSPTGRVVGKGEAAADGALQLEFGFEAVSIRAATPYFAAGSDVDGSLTGSLHVDGSVDRPAIALEATLRESRLRLGEIALRGTLHVDATIRDLRGAPHGVVEIDATEAELGYAGAFTKAPGIPARVVGQVTAGKAGTLAIESWKFEMHDLDGQVRLGPRLRRALAGRPPDRAGHPTGSG